MRCSFNALLPLNILFLLLVMLSINTTTMAITMPLDKETGKKIVKSAYGASCAVGCLACICFAFRYMKAHDPNGGTMFRKNLATCMIAMSAVMIKEAHEQFSSFYKDQEDQKS